MEDKTLCIASPSNMMSLLRCLSLDTFGVATIFFMVFGSKGFRKSRVCQSIYKYNSTPHIPYESPYELLLLIGSDTVREVFRHLLA